MILEELVLFNFGVYRGRQALRLAPPNKDRPIVLIGGLNGEGKTSLLDAVQLALYGPLATISNRKGLAYESYLARMMHRGVDPEAGTFVELSFRTFLEGQSQTYRVRRTWGPGSTGRVREGLDVYHNGQRDVTLSERWPEMVEAFVPRGVAPLFFFDAEQIKRFANLGNAAAVLQTAIGSLLGLDLVDRLRSDLEVLLRRKRQTAAPDGPSHYLERLEEECRHLSAAVASARAVLDAARQAVTAFERSLHEATDRFRKEGGELFENRSAVEGKLTEALSRVASLEGELLDLAAGPTCFLLPADLLNTLAVQVDTERDAVRDRTFLSLLSTRDQQIIESLSPTLPRQALAAVSTALESDRYLRDHTRTPAVIGLGAEALDRLRLLLQTLGSEHLAPLNRRLDDLRTARSAVTELERTLGDVPSADVLQQVEADRDATRKHLEEARVEMKVAEERLLDAQRALERATKRRDAVHHEAATAVLEESDLARFHEHANKSRTTLERFRTEAVRRHLSRIEQSITDSLAQLLRKSGLVRSVHITPESMELELRDPSGRPVSPDGLSAGERQLLALSMLWGLAKASGRPLPVIVDTPLGRLDGSHREHLLTRYFPFASHQVLLLSTDEEVDAPALKKLQPHIGRSYRLEFNDKSSATEIHEGYLC